LSPSGEVLAEVHGDAAVEAELDLVLPIGFVQ
jgi:hypothetical protein